MAKSKDVVKQIRKATRRKFSAEEKIRIVLEGLEARSLSQSFAGGKAYRPVPTTNGQNHFLNQVKTA